ncbi:MAG TPA: heme-binding protein [Candidatus Acidoferrales bacterium]|nr:heme-binding protein [Candidatus Acidoferrales bacterium]
MTEAFEGRKPPNALNPELAKKMKRDLTPEATNYVTRNTTRLTLEGAKAVLAAAERRAIDIRVPMNIAVVDDGGHLLAFLRMDGAKLSSVQIAILKAHASAIRRKPTDRSLSGDNADVVLSLALAIGSGAKQTPIRGGVPLIVDDQIVGAIGVSNGTEAEDVDVARAGAMALAAI